MPDMELLRIGDVARRAGITPRAIRHYEQLGLISAIVAREAGAHRLYGADDVERLAAALRLKELLGLSLEELGEVVEAEDARAALHEEPGSVDPVWRRQALEELMSRLDRQLELVRRRRQDLDALERDIAQRRWLAQARTGDLG